VRLRIRHATFFAIVRAILDLEANPRPRGYDKVEGGDEICRIWVGRDWRVLYSISSARNELIVEAVRRTEETPSVANPPAARAAGRGSAFVRAMRSGQACWSRLPVWTKRISTRWFRAAAIRFNIASEWPS